MLPSEWKVTHTVLLFVFTVGGATLPQNLREGRETTFNNRNLSFE